MLEKHSHNTLSNKSQTSTLLINHHGELLHFSIHEEVKQYILNTPLKIGMNAFELTIFKNLHDQINYACTENTTLIFEKELKSKTKSCLFTFQIQPLQNQVSISLFETQSTDLSEQNRSSHINPSSNNLLDLDLSKVIGLDLNEFFNLSLNAIILSDCDSSEIIKSNKRCSELLGIDIYQLESLSLTKLFNNQLPDIQDKIKTIQEGEIIRQEYAFIKNNEIPMTMEVNSKKIISGHKHFIYSTISDITHVKLKKKLNTLQFKILQETNDGQPLEGVIHHICKTIKDAVGANYCLFLNTTEKQKNLHLITKGEDIPSQIKNVFNELKTGEEGQLCGQLYDNKKTSCIGYDVLIKNQNNKQSKTLIDHQIRSCWTLPVLKSNKSVSALIVILFPTNRPANADLIEVLEHLCQIISFTIEHKASEEKLKSSETRYKDLVNFSPMGIAIHNRNNFMFANKEACKILDIEHAEIIGKNVADFVKKEDIKSHHLKLKTIHVNGEIPLREEKLITNNGEVIWVLIRDVLIQFRGQRCNQIVFYDITELKKVEKSLIESQELLNKTGLAAKIGGWSLDVTDKSLQWTDQTYLIHEIEIGSPLDIKSAINFYPPNYRKEVVEVINSCIKDGSPWNKNWELITSKGNTIWVNATGEAIYNGKKVIQISGTFRDITEFKKQEEIINNNTQKLKNAHKVAKLGSWEFINGPKELTWSNELYDIFDIPQDTEVTLKSFKKMIHPDYQDKYDNYVNNRKQTNNTNTIDLKIIHPTTQKEKYVLAIADSIYNGKGEIIKTTGTVQDITERKLLEISEAQRSTYSQVLLEFGIMSSFANNSWFIITQCCKALVEKIDFDFVWVSTSNQDNNSKPFAPPHFQNNYFKKKIETSTFLEFARQKPHHSSKTTIIGQISVLSDNDEWNQLLLNSGINSYAIIPYYQDEKNHGTINLYSRNTNFIDDVKSDFLTQLASELGKNLNSLELKKASKELNEYNKLLINSLNAFSVKMDLHTKSINIFGDPEKFVGYNERELINIIENYKEHMVPSEKQNVENKLFDSKNNLGHFDIDFRFQKKDKSLIWLKTIGKAHWQGKALRKIIAIVIDITAQKEREIKLVKAQVKGRDDERRRIAKDIHDSLGQLLTVANLNIQSIKKESSFLSPQKQQVYNDTCDIINEAMDEARGMSHALMPSLLIDFGLVRSIKSDIQRISKTVEMEFNFIEFIDKKRYHIDIESNIYNIARECVNNAIKHAQAKNIDIELKEIDHKLMLTVDDNGIGFNPKEMTEGIGMQNIKSRVFSLNGELNIESKNGTHISVEVSLL